MPLSAINESINDTSNAKLQTPIATPGLKLNRTLGILGRDSVAAS
jgi:hypothetical protein